MNFANMNLGDVDDVSDDDDGRSSGDDRSDDEGYSTDEDPPQDPPTVLASSIRLQAARDDYESDQTCMSKLEAVMMAVKILSAAVNVHVESLRSDVSKCSATLKLSRDCADTLVSALPPDGTDESARQQWHDRIGRRLLDITWLVHDVVRCTMPGTPLPDAHALVATNCLLCVIRCAKDHQSILLSAAISALASTLARCGVDPVPLRREYVPWSSELAETLLDEANIRALITTFSRPNVSAELAKVGHASVMLIQRWSRAMLSVVGMGHDRIFVFEYLLFARTRIMTSEGAVVPCRCPDCTQNNIAMDMAVKKFHTTAAITMAKQGVIASLITALDTLTRAASLKGDAALDPQHIDDALERAASLALLLVRSVHASLGTSELTALYAAVCEAADSQTRYAKRTGEWEEGGISVTVAAAEHIAYVLSRRQTRVVGYPCRLLAAVTSDVKKRQNCPACSPLSDDECYICQDCLGGLRALSSLCCTGALACTRADASLNAAVTALLRWQIRVPLGAGVVALKSWAQATVSLLNLVGISSALHQANVSKVISSGNVGNECRALDMLATAATRATTVAGATSSGAGVEAAPGQTQTQRNGARCCDGCGSRPSDEVKLLRCVRCKEALYCNDTCQKAHWRTHKHNCVKPSS